MDGRKTFRRLIRFGWILLALLVLAFFLFSSNSRQVLIARKQERAVGSMKFAIRGQDYVTREFFAASQSFPIQKAEGTLRVFVVGGSQAMGAPYVRHLGVPGFARFLPKEGGICTWLKAYLEGIFPGRTIEVVNAAMVSSGISSHLEVYKDILAFGQADAVVLLCGPDIRDPTQPVESWDDFENESCQRLKKQFDDFVSLARRSGVPLYVLTVANNVRDWIPYGEKDLDIEKARSLIESHDFVEALRLLHPTRRSAQKMFYAAKCYDGLGKLQRARELYVQAKDRDPQPYRFHSSWNSILRGCPINCKGVASTKSCGHALGGFGPNVHVLDMERILYDHAIDGIPGWDMFHDYGHLKLETNQLVAREIVKRWAQDGFIPPTAMTQLNEIELPDIRPWYLGLLYAAQRFRWWQLGVLQRLEGVPFLNAERVREDYRQESDQLWVMRIWLGRAENLSNQQPPMPPSEGSQK